MVTKISKEMDLLKQGVSKTGKLSKNLIGKEFNQLKKHGENMSRNIVEEAYYMGEKTKNALHKAEDLAKEGVQNLEGQVKAHPMLAIGASFVIGMLLGKLGSNK